MDRETVETELRNIAQGLLNEKNIDLVDLVYRYEGNNLVVGILADRPEGGISLGECTYINKEISRLLDEKDFLQGRYILEVSSPGLDRPLKTIVDFRRCINRKARVFLSMPIEDKLELEGRISRIGLDMVGLDISGRIVEIPIAKIIKAKQTINEAA